MNNEFNSFDNFLNKINYTKKSDHFTNKKSVVFYKNDCTNK